jgi:hypothetical protein
MCLSERILVRLFYTPGTRLSYMKAHEIFELATRAAPSHPTPLAALARLQEHCHDHPLSDPLVAGSVDLEILRAMHLNVSELERMDPEKIFAGMQGDAGAAEEEAVLAAGEGRGGGGGERSHDHEIIRPDWKAEAERHYRRAITLDGGGRPAGAAGAGQERWEGADEKLEPPMVGEEGLLLARMGRVKERGVAFAKASLADLLLQKSRGADDVEEEAVMLLGQVCCAVALRVLCCRYTCY